jgi:predicted RND superfamily exporter protein
LIRRLLEFTCRHSLFVFVMTAVLTAFFGYYASHLRVDPDVASLLPESAEIVRLRERYKTQGITGEFLVLAVESENPFTIDKLRVLNEVYRRLEELPEIEEGITPFSLMTFERQSTRLTVVPIAPGRGAPQTSEELAVFRRRLTETPYTQNLVLSEDGTVLNAFFPAGQITDFSALMRSIDEIAGDLEGYYKYYVSGSIPFVEKTGTYLSRDLSRLFLFAALVILAFYFLGFHSLRGVLLPFLVVILGTTWSLGFMSLLGFRLTIVSIIAPPLVLTLGSSYSIHILNQYYRSTQTGRMSRYWVIDVVESINRTILMAAATTVVGFLSLLVTSIRQTREFALSASFGILSCALLSLFFFPAVLSRLKPPARRQVLRVRSGFSSRIMAGLGALTSKWRVPVLAGLVVLVLAFGFSLTRLNTNTDTIGYFPRRARVVKDMYFLTSRLGGFDEIHLTLTAPGGEQGYFLQPEILREVSELELALRSLPDISHSISFPAFLRFMNRVMNAQDKIPESRAPIIFLSRFMKIGGFPNLYSEDFSQLTLSFRIYNSKTQKFIDEQGLRELLERMNTVIGDSLPAGVRTEIWGQSLQYLSLSNLLRRNLSKSMFLSVLFVLGITTLAFRSLACGLLAIVPLVTGVMLNFVFMAAFRIPLDMTTIMVSAVAIGVGVDDAIHFIIHYRQSNDVAETLLATGRPILLTTVSIVGGLLVLTLASFRPIIYFGMLVVFTLSATCVSTLVVLPALLGLVRSSASSK